MRKALFSIVTLAAIMTFASSSSAGTWFTKTVNAGATDVWITSAPDSFVIGNLFYNAQYPEHFTYNTDDQYGDFRWGHARGSADKCGWVNITKFYQNGNLSSGCESKRYLKSTALGEASRIFLRQYYAKAVNDYVPAGGAWPFFINTSTGTPVYVQQSWYIYGNVGSDGWPTGPIVGAAYANTYGFLWRWVNDSGNSVLGKEAGGNWGFLPRFCLQDLLKYADYRDDYQTWRADWQAGG